MIKKLLRSIVKWALGIEKAPEPTVMAQPFSDPWWHPINPYGTSEGVGYGTVFPSLSATGGHPGHGEVFVEGDPTAPPAMWMYDQTTSTWVRVGGDLTDYLYLPGRSGGQIAHGGVDANDDLTLRSTAHATKGYVILDDDFFTDRWLTQVYNTVIGVDAFGDGNLAHGSGSEGWYNSAFGNLALESITTGNSLTAIGFSALREITTGRLNVGIGAQAGRYNQTGIYNTYVGTSAGFGVSGNSHNSNTLIGYATAQDITTGGNNATLGAYAARELSAGAGNVAAGAEALYWNQTGGYNTCAGYQAGAGASGNSHSNNAFFGYRAGYTVTTGGNNTCLGTRAGEDITTGAGNVCIGYRAGESRVVGDSNELWIHNSNSATPLIYGEFDTGFIRINNHIYLLERSSDPGQPAEGECVIWMSDGTGKGDDGDVMIASQAGGVTNYGTLFDHSGGAAW